MMTVPSTIDKIQRLVGVIFTALVALILILCAVPLATVAAEEASATDVSGFDNVSSSGCINNANISHSPSYSIYLNQGEANFNLKDFDTAKIDFYIYFRDYGDIFHLVIIDEDDTTNKVTVKIKCVSANTVDVTVEDSFKGQTETVTEREAITMKQQWKPISVKIVETDSATDGTIRTITVRVAGYESIDSMKLQSAEQSMDVKVRKWSQTVFKSPSSGHEIYIDDVYVTTGERSNYAFTLTIVVILFATGFFIVAWRLDFWPFRERGYIKRRIRR